MVRRPVKRVPPSRRQYVLQSPALQAARRLPGVKAGPMRGFVEPSLATLRPEAPNGDRWVHEINYDGYRLQLHVHNGRIRLFTRRGHNWTDRFESASEVFTARRGPLPAPATYAPQRYPSCRR